MNIWKKRYKGSKKCVFIDLKEGFFVSNLLSSYAKKAVSNNADSFAL